MRQWFGRQRGALTVDATLALTMTIFLTMFLVDVGKVYMVQNQFHHAIAQAVKEQSLSGDRTRVTSSEMQTSIREAMEDKSKLVSGGKLESLSSVMNYDKINNAKTIVETYDDGKYSLTYKASYDVPLTFPFLGWDKVTICQSGKAKMWD